MVLVSWIGFYAEAIGWPPPPTIIRHVYTAYVHHSIHDKVLDNRCETRAQIVGDNNVQIPSSSPGSYLVQVALFVAGGDVFVNNSINSGNIAS